jgi:hypothetical protein
MIAHDFAPRRVGELLDDAIGLVTSNWRTLLTVSAVVVLPIAAAYSVVASFYFRSIFDLSALTSSAAGSASVGLSSADVTMLVTALLMQGLGFVFAIARSAFDATLYVSSPQLLEHRRARLRESLRAGMKMLVPVAVVQLISGASAATAAGVVLVVGVLLATALIVLSPVAGVAGVVVAYLVAGAVLAVVTVLMTVAQPIVAIEGGIGHAIGRSLKLVRRHFWRVLVVTVAVGLLGAQFESALAAPTIVREIVTGVQQSGAAIGQIAWGWKVFDGLAQGIAIAIVLPFTTSATLLNYLDLRARDEGMDLIVRARGLLPG